MPVDGVTVTRVLQARRERVFEAWTRPDLMARWFFPGEQWIAVIASELTVGGQYKITMHDTEGGQHVRKTNMNAIKHEIGIRAPVGKVYQAITRQSGYRGWWNAVGEVAETVGGEAKLHFIKEGTPVNMKFRIDEMKPNQSVRWTCTGHDMPSWVGTTLNWTLKESAGATSLSLDHGGWKGSAPEAVAQGWKHFLGSLKSYVESGTGRPW